MRILVAYASRAGATADVAEAIGRTLRDTGDAAVEVAPADEQLDLARYDLLVLGSAIRGGRTLPEAARLGTRWRAERRDKPIAYFVTCATLKDATPENRARVMTFLDPLRRIQEPVSIGLFGGRIDFSRESWLQRRIFTLFGASEGDWRDWDEIADWARQLARAVTRSPARAS